MKWKILVGSNMISIGLTLILDKIWWLYYAPIFDNPFDHYIVGAILTVLGVILIVIRKRKK